MDRVLVSPILRIAILLLCVALVLGGQAISDTVGAIEDAGSPAVSIERAGFAYFTGVRTFIAAALWNRLDPVYHEYYHEVPLADQMQMYPTISLVTLLNPEFEEAYYVGAWSLARRGLTDEAIELAALGVVNNPASGILHVNYAQILWFTEADMEVAFKHADIALEGDVHWRDLLEQHDSYAVLRGIFNSTGHTDRADAVLERIEYLDAQIGDALPEHSHDHDGDGVPDH